MHPKVKPSHTPMLKSFSNIQAANLGIFATIAVRVLAHFDIVVSESDMLDLITAAAAFFFVVYSFVHRLKKGDITVEGFRYDS